MARRLARPAVLGACLALMVAQASLAAPGASTVTSHYREQGAGLDASFSNVTWDEEGNLPAGDYFETYVSAADYLARGDDTWQSRYVCVDHYTFSVDGNGEWWDGDYLSACGEADTLHLDTKFRDGHVSASFMAQDCVAWDDETGDCLEWAEVGEVAIDLAFTGTGAPERWHGTDSGGSAGSYQYLAHGVGASRMGDVAGTVTFDGASLVDDATWANGWMFRSRSGYVDVWHLSDGFESSALRAGTSHYRERGAGLDAGWSNAGYDDEGNLPPGDYSDTWVSASDWMTTGDETWAEQTVCVEHYAFTIDANGEWQDGDGFWACGPAETLVIGTRLDRGRLVASIDVQDCTSWDDETGECLTWDELGTVALDLTLTGTGQIRHSHGTSSGGTAGMYQYVSHGTGSDRAAEAAGTVSFNGVPLIEDATASYASLYRTRSGWMDIWHE